MTKWIRIARWNDETDGVEQHIDMEKIEYCNSFEITIINFADSLTRCDFVNNRVKKASRVLFDVFETNGIGYVIEENYGDLVDSRPMLFKIEPKDIRELVDVIKEIGRSLNSYCRSIDSIESTILRYENNKVKQYKIVAQLNKFKKAVNQYYNFLEQEYGNIDVNKINS